VFQKPIVKGALAVLCVLVVFAIATAQPRLPREQTQKGNLPATQTLVQKPVTFTCDGPLAFGIMVGKDGKSITLKNAANREVDVEGGATSCGASDGKRVSKTNWNLVSPEFATDYLKKVLLNAQVLKREPRTNERGEPIGERIVALLNEPSAPNKMSADDPRKTAGIIIITEGVFYLELRCDSLDDALAFEEYAKKFGQAPARWESVDLPFRPIYITSVENVFWVCGADEMLAESEDEGRTWQLRHQKMDGEVLLHAGFLNKEMGYATGTNGILLWTRDSGKTWTSNGSSPNSIRDVFFADKEHGLRQTISGVDITHDGGSSWAPVSILKSDKTLRAAKLFFGLAVLDGNRAAILVKDGPYGGQVIVYTVDGGKMWNKTDIPHSGIRRLVAHGGEYWVFGHEVIDRERGDGGYGVALAAHSQDGLHWLHGVRSPNEYSNCNSQGCIIHDGAIVELYQDKPQFLALPADGTLTPIWAMAGEVVCTIGSTLKCADARPSEVVPPAPEMDRPISQRIDTREPAIGCLVCDLEPFPAPKSRVGQSVLELDFVVHKDGTVGDVRVKHAPAKDVEISVERAVASWVFEPPHRSGQAFEETRKVKLGIACFSFPSNEEATCSFTVIPVAGG
jgi:hypothetical protein